MTEEKKVITTMTIVPVGSEEAETINKAKFFSALSSSVDASNNIIKIDGKNYQLDTATFE